MAVILVMIICVLKRYRRKHSHSSAAVLPTETDTIPNNIATITAAKKEKDLNEGTYTNPSYVENEYYTVAVPQNYEISNDDVNIYDEVPH